MDIFRKTIKLVRKKVFLGIVLTLTLVIVFGTKVALAEWQEPNLAPPAGDFYAPLNVGAENQAKEGYLQLNPEYNPTESFGHEKPLDVLGTGARFSTPYLYGNVLTVDTNTLYADALNDWVGIGTTTASGGIRLKVVNGTVRVGTESTPVASRAVSGLSTDATGIYSESYNATQGVGIYGLRLADSGWAVKGESKNSVGVKGESLDGYGIYAVNDSDTMASVYGGNTADGLAGYFNGRIGAGLDIVANRFLPENLQKSLLSFTSGQQVAEHSFGTWSSVGVPLNSRLVFDGTYIWVGADKLDDDGYNLFKTRVADGQVVKSFAVAANGFEAMVYDGKYIWLSSNSTGDIYRFDPLHGIYETVANLSVNVKYSLAVSSIDGQAYVWATDQTGNKLIKVNVSSLDYDLFDFTDPTRLVFDGTYLWVTAQSGHIVRLMAADPNDEPLAIDTATAGCHPYGVYFDGEHVWCLQGASESGEQLKRIWAENPSDVQHPVKNFGPSVANNMDMVFDGTYLWVVNYDKSKLYRYLATDPSSLTAFDLGFPPERIVFDGTNLWILGGGGKVYQYYSGTGMGHTDLNSLVALNPMSTQSGSMSVAGSGEVGSDTTAGSDVSAPNNLWGGSDDSIAVIGGLANCQDGQFLAGVTLDANSQIIGIVCREL